MPRGERRTYSKETQQDKVAGALQTLEQGIDSILTSSGFAAYLRSMASFHQYSSSNIALIFTQRPDASRVAGYQRWKELGRQVKKGERSISILVPHKQRIKAETEDEEDRVLVRGFGTGMVFDVSQTEGDPLPEPPQPQVVDGASDVGMRLYVDLLDYLESRGVSTAREHLATANGYFDPARHHIAVGYHIDGDQASKTLTHETAHMVAKHTVFDNKQDVETVAESAAYVVLNHYQVDSSGYSFPYVSRWAQDRTVFKRNLDAIQQVSHQIIGTLEGTGGHVLFDRHRQP